MRRAARLAGALLALAFARGPALADGPPEPPRAFVEWTLDRTGAYVGQAVDVGLRVGWDAAWFAEHAVPPFLRATDVPVAVRAPGWDAPPGATRLREAPDDRPRLTLALGDRVVEAARADDVVRDGRAYAVLDLARRVAVSEPGTFRMPAPTLRYVHASSFREDLLGNRVPVDVRETVVEGAPRELRVDDLPEEGRPAGFAGAVGRFRIGARADRAELRADEALRVVVTIEGEGNLELADAPRPGLHVLGTVDDRGSPTRTIRYDLAFEGPGASSVPPIELAYFDPGPPGGYRVARTESLPVTVRPAAGPGTPSPAAPEEPPAAQPGGGPWTALGAALVVAALVATALRGRRRARASGDAGGPTRLARALDDLRAAAARPGADLGDTFAEALAARLDCAPAAVVAEDLEPRLVAAGVAPDAASRAAEALKALVAARYGGTARAPAPSDLVAAAESVAAGARPAP